MTGDVSPFRKGGGEKKRWGKLEDEVKRGALVIFGGVGGGSVQHF